MVFLAFGASAQEKQHAHHGKHKAKHHREHITKNLDLTEDQKQQLKTINENHREQLTELKKNENISVKEMKDRRAALSKEHRSAIEGMLTAGQKAKMQDQRTQSIEKRKQMQAHRMEKMKKDLALTDDQSSKLKSINQSYKSKFETLKWIVTHNNDLLFYNSNEE